MFELEKEGVSGQPGGEDENLHLLLLPKRAAGEKRRDTLESEEMVRQINGGKKLETVTAE